MAEALFEEAVVPLAEARRARGAPDYFPKSADPEARTYFESPACARMTAADFEFPGGGTPDGLVDALAAHWHDRGDEDLADLVPRLKAIAAALAIAPVASEGDVDILCYTMF